MATSRKRDDGPDRDAALAQYRRRAAVYDLELALFEPVRRRAVSRLALRPGQTVLDVGCGTGLSFELLQQAVGARGHVVGIEQSPEMMARAQQRVAQHGWTNITLLHSPVENARVAGKADGALLHFTHDIVQREDAVANVMQHLNPGASVVASGLKWAPLWAAPINLLFVWPAALRSVSSLSGMHRPWSKLVAHLGEPELEALFAGAVYIARWPGSEP